MFHIGIDWADDHHDIFAVNDIGRHVADFRVKADREGLAHLRDRLGQLSAEAGGKDQVAIGIETSRLLLVDLLLNDGYTVYPINPKAIDRYRDRYTASQAKSDRFDAEVIANALRTDRERFRPIQPDSPLVRELRILVRDQRRLIRTKTMFLNQLQAALKDYYPVVLEFFDDFDGPSALAFLAKYTLPARLGAKPIERLLRSQHHPHPEQKAQQIAAKLSEPFIPVDEFTVRAKSRLVRTLVEQLQALRAQIQGYQKEIENLFEKHPDSNWIQSLPGAGPGNGPRLLTELGDNRARYESPDRLQCEAGTCPVTASSGKSNFVFFRRACRKSFRDTMHQFSFCSMNQSTWARALYDQSRAKGKTNASALRVVGDKWLKIIYHLWKERKPYDENVFLASRMRYQLQQSGAPA